jgi:hypothetical protein
MGYPLDWRNLRTLTEKMQLLKLKDRSPLHVKCADKIAVRDYVSEVIGEGSLVQLVGVYNSLSEFKSRVNPGYPTIVKTSHDSGSTFVLRDQTEDMDSVFRDIKISLGRNYYRYSREWQYRDIVPRILEEHLLLIDGNIPSDIKAHCFNGKVEFFQVDVNRGSENHYRDFYFKDWEKTPFVWNGSKEGGIKLPSSVTMIPKPPFLRELIEDSEKLASPFRYVRVDWYDMKNSYYFGELTFHHDSGFVPIIPYEWDLFYGDKLSDL